MDVEETFRRSLYMSYRENKCILLPKEEYIKTVGELLEATQAPTKSPRQFYLLKKYELLQYGDVQKLTRKKPNQEHPQYVATIEETFDIIQRPPHRYWSWRRRQDDLGDQQEVRQHDAITLLTSMCIEGGMEMFYLTTHSTHFMYCYMASDIWLRTILIVRKEIRCRHIGYSYRLSARVLLYAPSHRQDNTYHGLCYTSRGALAMCIECQRKRKRTTTKEIVVKPILSVDFSSRAQVDLIDMQSMCQGQHKWIMVYQVLHPASSHV